MVTDRLQQVCLAETDAAIDNERIKLGLARRFARRKGSRMRKTISLADDEGLEDIALIQWR